MGSKLKWLLLVLAGVATSIPTSELKMNIPLPDIVEPQGYEQLDFLMHRGYNCQLEQDRPGVLFRVYRCYRYTPERKD